jgi:uncharacterized membrane protein
MHFAQGTFTKTYTMNLRVADALGVLAGILLILSPMINPHVSVGLGIAFLLWVAFCQVVRRMRKRESN